MLVLGFSGLDFSAIKLYASHFPMYLIMYVAPTPGGSGISEWVASNIFPYFITKNVQFKDIIAILWRFFAYHLHIIIAFIVVFSTIRNRLKVGKEKNGL